MSRRTSKKALNSPTGAPDSPIARQTHDLALAPTRGRQQDVHRLITAVANRKSIACPTSSVSTISDHGAHHLAPYSYVDAMGHNPPVAVVDSGGDKDSSGNIQVNGEFVVNVVTEEVLEKMSTTASDFPAEHNEFRM